MDLFMSAWTFATSCFPTEQSDQDLYIFWRMNLYCLKLLASPCGHLDYPSVCGAWALAQVAEVARAPAASAWAMEKQGKTHITPQNCHQSPAEPWLDVTMIDNALISLLWVLWLLLHHWSLLPELSIFSVQHCHGETAASIPGTLENFEKDSPRMTEKTQRDWIRVGPLERLHDCTSARWNGKPGKHQAHTHTYTYCKPTRARSILTYDTDTHTHKKKHTLIQMHFKCM